VLLCTTWRGSMLQRLKINDVGIRVSVSLLISLALAFIVWAIFFPGTMSSDSLYTYNEAINGDFSDVRPPLITFILYLFIKSGGGLGLFTLLECLLGFLGVRRLLMAEAALFGANLIIQDWIAVIGLLLLSVPLTPMPVYFVTLWFDSWLAIFLLWSIALLLELLRNTKISVTGPSRSKIYATLVSITLVISTRWNSLILFLPLIFVWLTILWKNIVSHRKILILAFSPLVFYLLFLIFQYEVIGVKRIHTERFAFALDLASMITYDPAICQSLPLRSCQIIQEKITSEFVVGNGAIDHTMNQGLGTVDPAFAELRLLPSLPQELWLAASHFPGSYLSVKTLNFFDYLRPRPRYYFQSFLRKNGMGLFMNERFETVRTQYISWLHSIYTHPILKMLSFAHVTWIFANLTGILYCFTFKRKSHIYVVLGQILLVPILYDLSYMIALTSSDFRYMYPSTLIMQVMTIGLTFTLFAEKINPHKKIL